ncbi:MAG: M23 family metallopeptidase [Pseudomonadales bacterium]|nr:M23 family metallopeptidase [Pseudomonadales bacterium]
MNAWNPYDGHLVPSMKTLELKSLLLPLLLVLLLLISNIQIAFAEIYRYQDENGRWHFLDNKPKDQDQVDQVDITPVNIMPSMKTGKERVVSVPQELCASDSARQSLFFKKRGGYIGKEGKVTIENEGNKDNPILFATNDYFAPVTVQVWFTENWGIRSSPKLPLTMEISAQIKKQVVDIKPIDPGLRWRYKYRTRHVLGTLNPNHDRNCYYLPPVPSGNAFRVTQAFNGKFSHNHDGSRHAVDIAMPENTPVIVARDGIVIARKTDFVLSGLSAKFKRRANSIQVLHGDGTISIYAHLKFRTLKFYEGEEVKAGQVIGHSGDTGYSTGPHLHFAIVSNQEMSWKTIPFQFYLNGKPSTPERGMKLTNAANEASLDHAVSK